MNQISKIEKTSSLPIHDKKSLEEFLKQPIPKIAELITGALEVGTQGMVVAGARIAQGALKGNFLIQFGKEINELINKGKIPDDYSSKKYGFQSFTELLKFIEEEDVDEDRMLAMKALFYAVNKADKDQKTEILNYQLFKLGKKVSASQIVLLRIIFELSKNKSFDEQNSIVIRIDAWSEIISKEIGHSVLTLIIQDAQVLIDLGLIKSHKESSNTVLIFRDNGGLSDLGMAFCKALSEYDDLKK